GPGRAVRTTRPLDVGEWRGAPGGRGAPLSVPRPSAGSYTRSRDPLSSERESAGYAAMVATITTPISRGAPIAVWTAITLPGRAVAVLVLPDAELAQRQESDGHRQLLGGGAARAPPQECAEQHQHDREPGGSAYMKPRGVVEVADPLDRRAGGSRMRPGCG